MYFPWKFSWGLFLRNKMKSNILIIHYTLYKKQNEMCQTVSASQLQENKQRNKYICSSKKLQSWIRMKTSRYFINTMVKMLQLHNNSSFVDRETSPTALFSRVEINRMWKVSLSYWNSRLTLLKLTNYYFYSHLLVGGSRSAASNYPSTSVLIWTRANDRRTRAQRCWKPKAPLIRLLPSQLQR